MQLTKIIKQINLNKEARLNEDNQLCFKVANSMAADVKLALQKKAKWQQEGEVTHFTVSDEADIFMLIRLGLDTFGMTTFMYTKRVPANTEILDDVTRREILFSKKILASILRKDKWDIDQEKFYNEEQEAEEVQEVVLIYCQSLDEANDMFWVAQALKLDYKYGELDKSHPYAVHGKKCSFVCFRRADISKHTDIIEREEAEAEEKWGDKIASQKMLSGAKAIDAMKELLQLIKSRKNCSKFTKLQSVDVIEARTTASFPATRVLELCGALNIKCQIQPGIISFYDQSESATLSMLADSGLNFIDSKKYRAIPIVKSSILDKKYDGPNLNGPNLNGPSGPSR